MCGAVWAVRYHAGDVTYGMKGEVSHRGVMRFEEARLAEGVELTLG